MKKVIYYIVIVLLSFVFFISAGIAVKSYLGYKKADDVYEELQDRFVETVSETTDTEVPTEEIMEPDEKETAPITIDFDALLKENADVVGWLYSPDTPINYPVVQGANNNQYLRKVLNGNYLVSGTIFVDYRNGAIGEDANYILYGHNMKDGTMFSSIAKYKEQAYYDEHPVLYYLTPNGNYKIELYAGIVLKRDAVVYAPNPDEAEFTALLEEVKANSTFKSDIVISDSDKLITLSTCSYEYNNARYILIGRLCEI